MDEEQYPRNPTGEELLYEDPYPREDIEMWPVEEDKN